LPGSLWTLHYYTAPVVPYLVQQREFVANHRELDYSHVVLSCFRTSPRWE
jgi:hypothetical protein